MAVACKLRVVILWADRGDAPRLATRAANVIPVTSPYEAAAEVLAAPTTALVVDMRLLSAAHLRLLQIARQMGAEILAVGAVPSGLTSESLSGVRLMARDDLGDAIAGIPVRPDSIGAPKAPPTAAQPVAELDEAELASTASASQFDGPPSGPDLDEMNRRVMTELLHEEEAFAVPSPRPGAPAPTPKEPVAPVPAIKARRDVVDAKPASHPGLLTPAELAALLEDQQ